LKISRILLVLVLTISLFTLVMSLFTNVYADNITVNSNLDTADPTPADGVCDVDVATSGNQCTLRAAIETAQGNGVISDVIGFAGSMDIDLNSSLPELVEDGLTVEAESGQTVRINGQGFVSNIFRISSNSVTISNVVVYGSGSGYSNIWVRDTSGGVIIANNLIGDDDPAPGGCGQSEDSFGGIYVDSTGSLSIDNNRAWIYGNIIECHSGSSGSSGDGITLVGTDGVYIGGLQNENNPAIPGNIIRFNNVGIRNISSSFIVVSGNVVENNMGHGITAQGGTDFFLIGCFPSASENPEVCRNRIRGNGEAGIYANGNNVLSLNIMQNWIGLEDDGVTPNPNNIGVHLHSFNMETTVFSNTISGNTEDGIRIQETRGKHEIWQNTIGLGVDGYTAVPNGSHGIYLVDDAGGNQIGLEEFGYGNTISGNDGHGILISNTPTTTIQSNLIGLARDGVTQRGNGYSGIYAYDSDWVRIGDALSMEEFYGTQKISGNGETGIYFENVTHSLIGEANDIAHNNGDGIHLYNSQNNIITPHLVAYNEDEGIQLVGNATIHNPVVPFEVRDNGRLPIELGLPGLEPNDPGDTVSGPNNLNNFPEVTISSGSVITGTACVSCIIAIYAASGDPTADGGGGTLHGFTPSDASGVWSVDLADIGLELRPVSLIAFTGVLSENSDSSPLSPVTQTGFGIYLPAIIK
jgi:hypothetical protein